VQDDPTTPDSRFTNCRFQLKIYDITLTVHIELATLRLPGTRHCQQLFPKFRGIYYRHPQGSREDTRFVAASRAV